MSKIINIVWLVCPEINDMSVTLSYHDWIAPPMGLYQLLLNLDKTKTSTPEISA